MAIKNKKREGINTKVNSNKIQKILEGSDQDGS